MLTKSKGYSMTGFWYPFVFRKGKRTTQSRANCISLDQDDFRLANRIELGAGYELEEIDEGHSCIHLP